MGRYLPDRRRIRGRTIPAKVPGHSAVDTIWDRRICDSVGTTHIHLGRCALLCMFSHHDEHLLLRGWQLWMAVVQHGA